ncbi:MAG: replication-associated recombination protein A [Acidobacteria bacterium]|nr:replication-associated recombination protein A [Acidobacteriota bacterium]
MGLFEPLGGKARKVRAPLADRMRPQTLEEFVGQEHLVGPGQPLRVLIETDELTSMILWGPPGSGKTTLARLIARLTACEFVPFSAVLAGIKEIKQVMAGAQRLRQAGRRTIVFVDEIHRFNKAQQDAFLPYVEAGDIVLIGATTENPSFEVIGPLLSRAKVYVLKPLTAEQLEALLERALAEPKRGLFELNVVLAADDRRQIAVYANGDARVAYNTLEAAALGSPPQDGRRTVTREILENVMQRRLLLYDKAGEEHFNLISALHKSVRNSDPDAALYWLARMLEAGEDPLYIARRLVRMASEDIGLADPQALTLTMSATQAVDFVGMPEGGLALAEAAVYLALAPKSNALEVGYGKVVEDVSRTLAEPVPLHLRNPVTPLMKDIGYGKGYQYAHDFDDKTTDMQCLPDGLRNRRYYLPTDEGFEKKLKQRLEDLLRLKHKKSE